MHSLRFGITAFLGSCIAPEDWIEPAVSAGVTSLEIRAEPGFAHPADMSASYARHLRRLARAARLQLSLHTPLHDLNPASAVPSVAAAAWTELASCLELAVRLEAKILVFHPGTVPHDHPQGYRERAAKRFSFGLQLFTSMAQANGVQLALENKQRGKGEDLVYTPEELLHYLRQAPGLGACLDLGHMNTLGLDPAEYIDKLGGHLVHVHIHDNKGERDEHLPLGEGTLNWRKALARLKRNRYKGTVVLELPDLKGIESSLARIRELKDEL